MPTGGRLSRSKTNAVARPSRMRASSARVFVRRATPVTLSSLSPTMMPWPAGAVISGRSVSCAALHAGAQLCRSGGGDPHGLDSDKPQEPRWRLVGHLDDHEARVR